MCGNKQFMFQLLLINSEFELYLILCFYNKQNIVWFLPKALFWDAYNVCFVPFRNLG